MYNAKEITLKKADNYVDFGKPYIDYPETKDQVDCCLPNNFLKCPQVINLEMCPTYMAQRCAEKWDEKCDIYSNSLSDDEIKTFINKIAYKKYCRLSDSSNCSEKCEPFDPTAQQSVNVCSFIGNEVLIDSNQTVDIGVDKPVNVSPDYMGKCQQDCDKIKPQDIKEDDDVMNACLLYGFCDDIPDNICKLAHSNGSTIKHGMLSQYCNKLAEKGSSSLNLNPPAVYQHKHKIDPIFLLLIFLIIVLLIVWFLKKKEIIY